MTAAPRPDEVDPVFAAVAKALYGDAVDPQELWLSKSTPDGADLNTPGQSGSRRKKLAAGLLAGTVIEGLAAKKTLSPLAHAVKTAGKAFGEADGTAARLKTLTPLAGGMHDAPKPLRRVGVKKLPHLGEGTDAALQVGNFAVGVGAARELLKPQKDGVQKALQLRVKPINPTPARTVTLKAKKPAGAPPVVKSFSAVGEIVKADSDKRQVFGWANVSELDGHEVVDRQGDIVPIEELEKAAYRYVLDCRIGGDQHARIAKADTAPKHTADLIESMVFTDEKVKALGLPDDFPRGWWVGMQVKDDQTWQLIKSGARTGFSVHGAGRREEVSKADPQHRAKGAKPQALEYVPQHLQRPYTGRRRKLTPLDKVKTHPLMARAVSLGLEAADMAKRDDGELKRRVQAAKNPPRVALRPVSSSAISSMGYQKQTRHLAYEMRSRPGQPYEYRVKPGKAKAALDADSKGRFYATEVRGKAKRTENRYTVGDRVRLFVDPPKEQS